MATAQTITIRQAQAGFGGVGHMTIFNWRKGTPTKEALPCIVDDAKKVSFKLKDVQAWAKKHKVPFSADDAMAAEGPRASGPAKKIAPAAKVDRKKEPNKASTSKANKKAEQSAAA